MNPAINILFSAQILNHKSDLDVYSLLQFFFKRWMEYEEQHGDAASVEHVTAAAQEFINSQMET